MLRRSCLARAATVALSAITNKALPPRAQKDCLAFAEARGFESPYWATAAQVRRGLNTSVKPNETPVKTALELAHVVSFHKLPVDVQRRVLTDYPPFFESAVGILSTGYKWNNVGASRLKRVLQTDEFRSLYVEVSFASFLAGEDWKPTGTMNISGFSSFELFNAEQLVHPARGKPLQGCAIDIVTGKRIPQPAHDLLVAHAIIRGYSTPLWVNEAQVELLSLKVKTDAVPVRASTLAGTIVPLWELPKSLQSTIVAPADDASSSGLSIYTNGTWERQMSKKITQAASVACNTLQQPMCKHWVDITHLTLRNGQPLSPRDFVLTLSLTAITTRTFFSIQDVDKPHLAISPNRSIAIVNGRLVGKQEELRLKAHSVKHKFFSPLWLTARAATLMGVGVKPKAKPVALGRRSSGEMIVYNVDDLRDPAQFLKENPPPKGGGHKVADSGWKNVLGRQKIAALSAASVGRPYWISASEVIIIGAVLKPGVAPIVLNASGLVQRTGDAQDASAGRQGGDDETTSGRELYNSQDTTDPVRVMALSHYYARPQGYSA